MFKQLLIMTMLITSLFGGVRELTDENFKKATNRGLVVVEFWATWNETNKVSVIDEWDSFDAKVYRLNIDLYPKIQADNNVVILPTIIFFDDGEEVKRMYVPSWHVVRMDGWTDGWTDGRADKRTS